MHQTRKTSVISRPSSRGTDRRRKWRPQLSSFTCKMVVKTVRSYLGTSEYAAGSIGSRESSTRLRPPTDRSPRLLEIKQKETRRSSFVRKMTGSCWQRYCMLSPSMRTTVASVDQWENMQRRKHAPSVSWRHHSGDATLSQFTKHCIKLYHSLLKGSDFLEYWK